MSAAGSTVRAMAASVESIMRFNSESSYARRGTNPDACDFTFGNPHEMPLAEIHEALVKWAVPRHQDWFAYRFSDPKAIAAVLASLRTRIGIDFDQADVSLTTGAFGALAATLRAVVDPGDEVIYLSPPWFFYAPMIISLGARPVRVDLPQPGFELPVDTISQAITGRTRAIIVNSPHNPSGRILQPGELESLAEVLRKAPNPVYLISDEAYCRILFDGRPFHSPVRFYDRSFLIYTYGKTLLAPGQRLGYIAMSPAMPDREELRQAITVAQLANGFAFPNALMQYALPDLERAIVDVDALQRRRDLLVPALTTMGYEALTPAGTFYVLVRSPMADDVAYTELLARENVFVMPGRVFELPGWFRISLTANDGMVERALPGFARAMEASRTRAERSGSTADS
jgi:aspartate aminotransferase